MGKETFPAICHTVFRLPGQTRECTDLEGMPMTTLMLDGINALAPGIARMYPAMVAGYVNGSYAWSQQDWDLFPHATRVEITVTASANAGDVLDVETGDAKPGQGAGWIAMRKAAGYYQPTIYCSRSVIPAVRAGTGKYVLGKDYDIWVADYTGSPHEVTAPGSPSATCAATQYESTGSYDASMVYDSGWPHRKPPAPPAPAKLPAPGGESGTAHELANLVWDAVPGAAADASYVVQVYEGTAQAVTREVITTKVQGTRLAGVTVPVGVPLVWRVATEGGSWPTWKVLAR